jgi:uroporphyrinogen decarboxylase
MIERISDWNCAMWEGILSAEPNSIDIMYVGDDPAAQYGMMINPDQWRRHFLRPLAKLFEQGKKYDKKIMFHICGNPTEILPDLIEIGMDILMPVQLSAKEMDPIYLKKEFGDHICFWGGIDTQRLLPFASPEQVRKEVRHLIDVFGKNGGYVLSSSHNIDIDVPVENIVAMYDEAARYYPF